MPKRETPLGSGAKKPVIRPVRKSAARKKRSRAGQIAFSVLVFLAVMMGLDRLRFFRHSGGGPDIIDAL